MKSGSGKIKPAKRTNTDLSKATTAEDTKTDLRKIKSVKKIKEAFLSLHAKEGYDGVTVSSLCKEAGISRGTFYAHFGNVTDVLDEVLDEALDGTGKIWAKYLKIDGDVLNDKCAAPFCVFVRESKKYRKLFTDDAFSSRIVDKLVGRSFDKYYDYIALHSDLTRDQLKSVMNFQISGCLAITKMSIRDNIKDWTCVRECIDKFVMSGIDSIMNF